MRIRSAIQAASVFALAACVPSSTYSSAPTPAPEPASRPAPRPTPPPVPVRIVPLEVSVVRSDAERLLVKTNRYAYVALFEVVPGRGVALLHPAPTQRRDAQLSGTSWVDVEWMMRDDDRGYSKARNAPERYVYALASDRPLRITDGAYNANYLRRTLGAAAYEASDPRATARALSRWFVTSASENQWSEDLFAVPMSPARGPRDARRSGGSVDRRDHEDNGRRAHGDPANAEPRGRGVGRGNGGGRDTPVVQPGAGRGNAGGRDTPVEQPALPRLERDSSQKTPPNAQPGSDTKTTQEASAKEKEKPSVKGVMNEALRKNGMKPASPAADSAAKPSPSKP